MSPEQINIEEEETATTSNSSEENWSETVTVAGQELVAFLQRLSHEAAVRRIIVKKSDGTVLFDIPVVLGALGLGLMGTLSVIPLAAALVAEFSIVVERRAEDNDANIIAEIQVFDALPQPDPDNLRKIKGVGPKVEGLLNAAGVTTYQQVANASVERLQAILDEAGGRYRVIDPSSWPAQASDLLG